MDSPIIMIFFLLLHRFFPKNIVQNVSGALNVLKKVDQSFCYTDVFLFYLNIIILQSTIDQSFF
jgi:hypothetical protein